MSRNTRRALYGRMAADTILNVGGTALLGTPATGYSKSIYYQVAPAGAGYPLIVFSKQAGTPTYTFDFGGSAAMDTEVWMVKGVDRSDTADRADAIADRLDALLTDGSLTISGAAQMYGGTIEATSTSLVSSAYMRRQSDISYVEDDDGTIYRHSGSLYRLIYSES